MYAFLLSRCQWRRNCAQRGASLVRRDLGGDSSRVNRGWQQQQRQEQITELFCSNPNGKPASQQKKGISCMWCGTSTQEVVLHLKQTQTPVQMEIVLLCDCCVFLHSGPLKRVLYHVFSTGMEYKQMLYHDFSTGRISYRALHPALPSGRDPRGHFAMFWTLE